MVCFRQTMPLQIFRDCLPQILPGSFLNMLTKESEHGELAGNVAVD